MSTAFTIVVDVGLWNVTDEVKKKVKDPAIVRALEPDGGMSLYFAGSPDVIPAARAHRYLGLACVRIPTESGVLHVDAEGYEASVEHLARFVRWILLELGPCRVFDDETGDELDALVPRTLFDPEPEFAR